MSTLDPHKPLRQDVRLLGELLGDTLRERGGQQLFDAVEHVRTLAKATHAGERPLADLASSRSGMVSARFDPVVGSWKLRTRESDR